MKKALLTIVRSRKWGWRLLRLAFWAYLALVGCAMLLENRLIFHPAKSAEGDSRLAASLGAEDCTLRATDGTRLHGWYCAPPRKSDRVVLLLHGNGGAIADRAGLIRQLTALPVGVFALDYRGYGKSAGTPSEQGLYCDADAAWRYLTLTRGIPASHIVLFGESLGGAIAIDLAARVHPAGLITQAAFTSLPDMAAVTLPFVPRFLVRTQMTSINKIPRVTCPKLMIHSRDDDLVPYAMGERLFSAAAEPKQFFEIKGAGHNDYGQVGGSAYAAALRDFLLVRPPAQEQRLP